MAQQEYSADELAALHGDGALSSDELDTDRPISVRAGRPARDSADAATKALLLAGQGIFSDIGEGQSSVSLLEEELASEDPAAAVSLNNKAIEADLRKEIWVDGGGTYYVSCSVRETAMRSMKLQGIEIRRKDLTSVQGTPGKRTRFQRADWGNHNPVYYASGSWKTNGGGPRIQGPKGGPGSCKFVIIQR